MVEGGGNAAYTAIIIACYHSSLFRWNTESQIWDDDDEFSALENSMFNRVLNKILECSGTCGLSRSQKKIYFFVEVRGGEAISSSSSWLNGISRASLLRSMPRSSIVWPRNMNIISRPPTLQLRPSSMLVVLLTEDMIMPVSSYFLKAASSEGKLNWLTHSSTLTWKNYMFCFS